MDRPKKHYDFNLFAAFISFFLLSMLMAPSCSTASQSPWDVKLPFKSAIITYNITGMENGTQTTYIKDYGKYRATYRDTSMTVMGFTQHMKTAEITTPEWIYSIDFTEGTGTKSVNPVKYLKEEFEKLSSSDKKKVMKNAEKMGISWTNNTGGKLERNAAKFLGYKCDVMTGQGMKLWMIAGTDLILKSEMDMMGAHNVTEATSIKTVNVPDSKFTPPSNISIDFDRESEEAARRDAREMIKSLLEGKPMTMPSGMIPSEGGMPQPPAQQQGMGMTPPQGAAPPADLNEMMKQLKALTGGQ